MTRRLAIVGAVGALWIWSAAVTWASLDIFVSDVSGRDFAAFYRSVDTWSRTGDLYDLAVDPNVNLNPPHLSILLFGPLLLWSLPAAAVVWVGLQGIATALAFVLIRRELDLPARHLLWILPIFVASSAVQHQWREGQVGGILLLLSTLAWVAGRSDRPSAAAWVTVGASIKPWIACWVPVLRHRQWLWTIVLGLAGVLIGVVLLGLDTWTDWSQTVQSRPVRPNVINLSLLAAIARATRETFVNTQGGWPYGQPVWVFLCAALVALSWRARSGPADRAWLVFGLAGILVSPFGWAYYLVVITGPLLAWGEANKWPWPALVGIAFLLPTREFMEQLTIQPNGWIGGSLASFGVLLLWATALWWREPSRSSHA